MTMVDHDSSLGITETHLGLPTTGGRARTVHFGPLSTCLTCVPRTTGVSLPNIRREVADHPR
jgi:hypothetical protein